MKRALLLRRGALSLHCHSPLRNSLNPNLRVPASSNRKLLRFFSSESGAGAGAGAGAASETNEADVQDVSNRALSLHHHSPPRISFNPNLRVPASSNFKLLRFFSSESGAGAGSETNKADVQDVSNREMRKMVEKYFEGDEEMLPNIFQAIMKRKLSGKHEETDEELLEELQHQPLGDVNDQEFESDFEKAVETDEEIDDLYNAEEHVLNKMVSDEFHHMDDKKWDGMIREAIEQGNLQDTRECEGILEDMLRWDELLPDETKRKVEEKFNELADLVERGVHTPEEAFELFKVFEDQIVMESEKKMEEEGPPDFNEVPGPDKKDSDDPPGEGPILRWQTRVVFSPGSDQWHPKNRKVKMGVTMKELGLSKHQFCRMRELVGKRYHPGKDELMITSERFEHREDNRKDCLRTLYSLIEEAGKANKMVQAARTSYVKDRLQANPAFMERLRAKTEKLRADPAFMERWHTIKLQESNPVVAP